MLKFKKNKSDDSKGSTDQVAQAMSDAFAKPTDVAVNVTTAQAAVKVADRSVAGRLRMGSLSLAIGPAVLATAIVAALAYGVAKNITENRVNAQLESVRAVQTEALNGYAESLKNTITQAAQLNQVIDATKSLMAEFPKLKSAKPSANSAATRDSLQRYYENDFGKEFLKKNGGQSANALEIFKKLPDETLAAQQIYIAGNENPLGKKDSLMNANDGSEYSRAHEKVHGLFGSLVKKFGIYDFFIVDPNTGFIVYTYFKELDFGTSLDNGPYAKTALGQAFAASRKATSPDKVWLSDFEKYLPSYNDQAGFMSVPVYDGANQIAVLVIQVPIDQINKVMTFDKKWANVGLGKTGQSFLIGKDQTSRSISRDAVENLADYVARTKSALNEAASKEIELRTSDIGVRKTVSDGLDKAFAGEVVDTTYSNWAGEPTMASFGPLKLLNQNFAIVTEMQESEALEPVSSLLKKIALAAFATMLLAAGIALYAAGKLTKIVTNPLSRLKGTVDELQAGDFEARTKMLDKDEFGELGRALDKLLDERVSQLNKMAKENEPLNNSVIEIMQAVGTIATSKDLSMKVPVTEDVTGAISDALNLLTEETSRVLRNVGTVSRDVAQATVAVKGICRDRVGNSGSCVERYCGTCSFV
jgi:methyl-accepting chemotaxis protein